MSQQDVTSLMERLQLMDQQHQALAATVEQQRAEIQQQRARADQAQGDLTTAANHINQLQATAATQQAQLAAAAAGSAGTGVAAPLPNGVMGVGATVDTRTLGRPQSFPGKREAWREFRFVFEAFASAAHPKMQEVFQKAESMGSVQIFVTDLDAEMNALSRQLYYMLVMLTTDDAHRMLSNVPQGNGAEAWRRLCWEYEPDVRVRHGAVLHALLRREFGRDGSSDLAVEIETLERDVRKWEEQSKKTLDDDIKMSVLMGGMQNQQVRQHLELNASRLTDYPTARAEVLNFAVARRTWVLDDPMQIGAIRNPKGGKKGKKGDGRGKDSRRPTTPPRGKRRGPYSIQELPDL